MTKTTIEIVNATKQERQLIADAIAKAAPGRQWHMMTAEVEDQRKTYRLRLWNTVLEWGSIKRRKR